jgi:hypothetical protein
MLSARQLLLMRGARDRAIDIAIAPVRTVVLLPNPDFRRRATRVSKETLAASCSALPHTSDRIGSRLRLGSDQSSWADACRCRSSVKGGGAEDARVRSAYPPILSVNADILAWQPSATSRHMQCSKRHCYSMTSSASESRLSEMAMPCAFAAFRLMISSNLSTCCTGRSVGLAPLRILTA